MIDFDMINDIVGDVLDSQDVLIAEAKRFLRLDKKEKSNTFEKEVEYIRL